MNFMATHNKNYFSKQQNAFLNPNLRVSLLKTVTSILSGQKIKQNEQKLNQLRSQPQYSLILCQILTTLHKTTLIQQNTFEVNKKNFILLEIRKNIERLNNEQCWWLLRDVYFSDNEKTAKMIKQICLSFQKTCVRERKCLNDYNQRDNRNFNRENNNYLSIFFSVNLQNFGIVGVVRYLTLVHGLLSFEFRNLQNRTVLKYGEMIVDTLWEILQWNFSVYITELSLTCLIMLHGFLMNKKCWENKQKWANLLKKISESEQNSSLINCLAKYLSSELCNDEDFNNNNNNLYFNNFNHYDFDQRNIYQQQECFLSAVKYCLSQTKENDLQQPQKLFYVDSLSILNLQWRRDIKLSLQRNTLKNNSDHIYKVIEIYKQDFTSTLEKDRKWLHDDEDEEIDHQLILIKEKKASILESTFELIPRNQLFDIILQRDSFQLLFMHLSTHCPKLRQYNSNDIEGCLNMLSAALNQQQDTYLFYKEKGHLIDILIRYIAKYYKQFEASLLLKGSYLLDLLAHKCDTIADECYELLTLFSEEMQNFYSSDLIEFVETSLTHVNSNEWQQTSNCYSHIIRLIIAIDPTLIFNNNQVLEQRNGRSLVFSSFKNIANPLQIEILKMLDIMISNLKKSFDYQQIHELNTILQYLLSHASHICHQLTYQDYHFITQNNFKYEILTSESAEVYFHFTKFSEQKHIFINSVNLYQFWQQCESEKLQFFVHVYLKLIHPSTKFFTSSEIDYKLNQLKKNLWHRFVSQPDQEQRVKIVEVFQKHPEELSSLFEEYHKIQLWGQIKNQNIKENHQQQFQQKDII